MASSPISRLRFLDELGQELDAPLEWSRGLIEIESAAEDWNHVVLRRNGTELPVFLKKLGGVARALADWPLSGAGSYELTLEMQDGSWLERRVCVVLPRKLNADAVEDMLDDVQRRLPASIAIGLKRGGALSGVEIVAPNETTLAEELSRLTRAVIGAPGRPGLSNTLRRLSDDPHQVLRAYEQWTDRERARRIDPARLHQAFSRPANVGSDSRPALVPERPVAHSVDTYENRLVKEFHAQVNSRLRLLLTALRRLGHESLAGEAEGMLLSLGRARQAAGFLDHVSRLAEPPGRVTMVLLKRPEYRAALESFLEFRRRALVRLREPATDVPLENLPFLYQTWGVLEVLAVALNLGADLGYRVRKEALTSRSRHVGELWVRLLRDGQPAVVLVHPESNRTIRITPQRTYSPGGQDLHSVSFQQKPDVAVEISEHGQTDVILFDPKYKLDSEALDGEDPMARPKKADIDAMHSYRDAIRTSSGQRVVRYAAILYPGPTKKYSAGLAALGAHPQNPQSLEASIREVLLNAVAPSSASSLVQAGSP